jgi:hypothetical protein
MEKTQPIKLIMTWTILPDHEQEYFEYVIREYVPGVQRLGCDLSDAWATVYGDAPQIMVAALFPSAKKARQIMQSEEWGKLNDRLQDFISDFKMKMVNARNGFQL